MGSDGKWSENSNSDFLFPVKGLSVKFRAKFLERLRKEYPKLIFSGSLGYLQNESSFNDFLNTLWNKGWVVYAKRPFNGPESVINYLARYTHRVAISNARIIKMENGRVYFKYRDRKDGDKQKIMELDAIEFLRRFMLHSLPKGFQRIRYYGLLGSRKKNENIDQIYVSKDQERPEVEIKEITPESFFLELFGININECPHCKHERLEPVPLDKHCREGPLIEIP